MTDSGSEHDRFEDEYPESKADEMDDLEYTQKQNHYIGDGNMGVSGGNYQPQFNMVNRENSGYFSGTGGNVQQYGGRDDEDYQTGDDDDDQYESERSYETENSDNEEYETGDDDEYEDDEEYEDEEYDDDEYAEKSRLAHGGGHIAAQQSFSVVSPGFGDINQDYDLDEDDDGNETYDTQTGDDEED